MGMANGQQTGGQRSPIRAIDGARYLIDSARPTNLNLRWQTSEEDA